MISPEELEVLLRLELASNRTLDWLMERIFSDDDPREAAHALKRLANLMPDENAQPLEAMHYYRGMRHSLSEEDFRWLSTGEDLRQPVLRRERLTLYHRYRELFLLELAVSRKLRRSAMALARDWSGVSGYAHEMAAVTRYRAMLTAAGVLFQLRIPGALDLCDAAAFGLFRMLYLRPAA